MSLKALIGLQTISLGPTLAASRRRLSARELLQNRSGSSPLHRAQGPAGDVDAA